MFKLDQTFTEESAAILDELKSLLAGQSFTNTLGATGTITEVLPAVNTTVLGVGCIDVPVKLDIDGAQKTFMLYTALGRAIRLPDKLSEEVSTYKPVLDTMAQRAYKRYQDACEQAEKEKVAAAEQALKEKQAQHRAETLKKSTLALSKKLDSTIPTISSEGSFYIGLGYLAKHAKKISAAMPDYMENWFTKNFGDAEHRVVDSTKTTVNGNPMQWTLSMTIDLDTNEEMPIDLRDHLSTANKKIQSIADTAYVFELVRDYGFSFGKKQNLAEIKKHIPEGNLGDFDFGYNLVEAD